MKDNKRMLSSAKILDLLRSAGMRLTQPRITVLTTLHQHPDWHITVEELYQHLLSGNERVTLATCCRVLHELCQCGLACRRVLSEGRSVFEIAKATHHDHMVQDPTGAVLEFHDTRLDALLEEIAQSRGLELLDRQLVLFICAHQVDARCCSAFHRAQCCVHLRWVQSTIGRIAGDGSRSTKNLTTCWASNL